MPSNNYSKSKIVKKKTKRLVKKNQKIEEDLVNYRKRILLAENINGSEIIDYINLKSLIHRTLTLEDDKIFFDCYNLCKESDKGYICAFLSCLRHQHYPT